MYQDKQIELTNHLKELTQLFKNKQAELQDINRTKQTELQEIANEILRTEGGLRTIKELDEQTVCKTVN